jgi:hypothetical protein
MDWVERCFAVANDNGGHRFRRRSDLAGVSLGTNPPDKSLAVAPGCIAPKPQPGVGGPGQADNGRGRFLIALPEGN